jgi:hypothetical protein
MEQRDRSAAEQLPESLPVIPVDSTATVKVTGHPKL